MTSFSSQSGPIGPFKKDQTTDLYKSGLLLGDFLFEQGRDPLSPIP
jgi:hypothetical protein